MKNERVNELFYVEVFGLIFMKKITHFLSEEEQMRTGFDERARRARQAYACFGAYATTYS